jgi:hypothetical protein
LASQKKTASVARMGRLKGRGPMVGWLKLKLLRGPLAVSRPSPPLAH